MKKLLVLFIISSLLFSCSSSKKSTGSNSAHTNSSQTVMSPPIEGADGSSFEKAIVIQEKSELVGVDAEYKWLAQNYPGYSRGSQALVFHDNKPYDILTIKTKDGEEKKVYFDISNFYGKF